MNDLVKRLRDSDARGVNPPQNWTTEAADLIESQAKEIARLKAGGCARDQGLTQYCAEAEGMAKEIERLKQENELLRLRVIQLQEPLPSKTLTTTKVIFNDAALKDAP